MRKSKPKQRILLPDPKFKDQLVTRFVNDLQLDGKKNAAFKIFYDAMDIVAEKAKDKEKSAIEVWKKALENITPMVEVKSRRIGGATFQVPMEVNPRRKTAISIKSTLAKEVVKIWPKNFRKKLWLHLTKKAEHLRKKKKLIEWPMQIRHLLILDFN